MKKTLWQKIYSFLGFWHYYEITPDGRYRVLYWCCLPYSRFYKRKFDLFRKKVED